MTTDDLTEADELSTIALFEREYVPLEKAVLALRPEGVSCELVFFASARPIVSTRDALDQETAAIVEWARMLSKPRAKNEWISILRTEDWLEREEGVWWIGIQRVLFSSCLMLLTQDRETRASMREAIAPGLEAVRNAYGEVLRRKHSQASLFENYSNPPGVDEIDDLFKD